MSLEGLRNAGILETVWSAVNDEEISVATSYAPYLRRQAEEIEIFRKESRLQIDPDIDYDKLPGLSLEVRDGLKSKRPRDLYAAGQLSGMTPAAMAILYHHVKAA